MAKRRTPLPDSCPSCGRRIAWVWKSSGRNRHRMVEPQPIRVWFANQARAGAFLADGWIPHACSPGPEIEKIEDRDEFEARKEKQNER